MAIKHGLCKKTRIYSIWTMMKQRCYNSNNKDYYNYGARGIRVCSEWRNNYLEFHNWCYENGYKEGLSIDRINPNGDYEPNNCRWATIYEQANNKRNTIHIIYKGKEMTLSDLSNLTGIKRSTIEMRYERGDRDDSLGRPLRKRIS